MAEVRLTSGQTALVDDADLPAVSELTWCPTGVAGYTQYAQAWADGEQIFMHRHILGVGPGVEVDHRNGNGLDNRRENLRVCTREEQMQNRGSLGGTSRFKGVYREAGRAWVAQIRYNGNRKRRRLPTEVLAALKYDEMARTHHGEFACVNFPCEGERGAVLDP